MRILKYILPVVMAIGATAPLQAQAKTHIINTPLLFQSVKPNGNEQGWVVASGNTILRSGGYTATYQPGAGGFSFESEPANEYNIAVLKDGAWRYITELSDLKGFIGAIDNADEASLTALVAGYFFDPEYKDYSSNYAQDAVNYYVEAAKITSVTCPLAKTNYRLTINKATGQITREENLGVYSEVYDKNCPNNPHHIELQKQIEEARQKQAEAAEKQKLINKKQKQKVLKRMRRD